MPIKSLLELRRIFGANAVHHDNSYYMVHFTPARETRAKYDVEANAAKKNSAEIQGVPLWEFRRYFNGLKSNLDPNTEVLFYDQTKEVFTLKLRVSAAEEHFFTNYLSGIKEDGVFFPLLDIVENSTLMLPQDEFRREIMTTLNGLGEADWMIVDHHDNGTEYYVTTRPVAAPGGVGYELEEIIGHPQPVFNGAGYLAVGVYELREEQLFKLREVKDWGPYLKVVSDKETGYGLPSFVHVMYGEEESPFDGGHPPVGEPPSP